MEITCDISMPIVIENKHEKKTGGTVCNMRGGTVY